METIMRKGGAAGIEPSVEYQYRDLEVIQGMRKKYVDPNFSYTAKPRNMRTQ